MLSDIYFCFQQVFKVCFGIEPIQGKPCKIACNSLQMLAKWQAEEPRTEAGHEDNILNWVGPKKIRACEFILSQFSLIQYSSVGYFEQKYYILSLFFIIN